MAFPDSSIGNQFPTAGFVSIVDLHNKIDTPLDAVGARVRDTGWTVPTLSNSWVAFGAPGAAPEYWLHHGEVFVDGLMKSGTSAATVFVLPVGMRPTAQKTFIVPAGAGAAVVLVSPAGVVQVASYIASGTNASVWLCFSFLAEQ